MRVCCVYGESYGVLCCTAQWPANVYSSHTGSLFIPRLLTARFRQTSPIRFNVSSVSSNNPLGRPAAGQRHRSLCQRGGLFGDHAQCLRLGLRSTCKKLHHPQMNNLLCLDTKHCSIAGDLHPVREQRVPSADYLLLEGQSQPALFVPRSDGDAPI
jgi:hypothetical protein